MNYKQKLNLLVFGGSGKTGKHFVSMALEAGHKVVAIVRTPSSLFINHPNLYVIKGDITQPETYNTYFRDKDAVISCLGGATTAPTTLLSEGVKNMLACMKQEGVKRIMVISAAPVELSPKLSPVMYVVTRYIIQRIFRHPYADARRMEALLRESDTNWTSMRPPRLLSKPLTGKYRFALNDYLQGCTSISRADLAHFMVNNILNKETYKAMVEIAY